MQFSKHVLSNSFIISFSFATILVSYSFKFSLLLLLINRAIFNVSSFSWNNLNLIFSLKFYFENYSNLEYSVDYIETSFIRFRNLNNQFAPNIIIFFLPFLTLNFCFLQWYIEFISKNFYQKLLFINTYFFNFFNLPTVALCYHLLILWYNSLDICIDSIFSLCKGGRNHLDIVLDFQTPHGFYLTF